MPEHQAAHSVFNHGGLFNGLLSIARAQGTDAGKRVVQPFELKGLDQIIKGVYFKRIAHVFLMPGCKDQDARRVLILNDARAFHTGFAGHIHIQKYDVRLERFIQGKQLVTRGSLARDEKALRFFDALSQNQADAFLVVGDQHPFFRIAHERLQAVLLWPGRARISLITTPRRMSSRVRDENSPSMCGAS